MEKMLPPEAIEKLKKEKELEERPCLRLPIPTSEEAQRDQDEEEEQTFNGVIEIDLA